jgi:hypothetical protein
VVDMLAAMLSQQLLERCSIVGGRIVQNHDHLAPQVAQQLAICFIACCCNYVFEQVRPRLEGSSGTCRYAGHSERVQVGICSSASRWIVW